MNAQTQQRWWQRWWPAAALVVVSGSRWIFDSTHPQSASTFASAGVACGSLGLLCAMVWLQRSRRSVKLTRNSLVLILLAAGCGAVFFVAPAFGSLLRGAAAEPLNRIVAFSFTPLVVWIGLRAVDVEDARGIEHGLWPALAAIAGTLAIFPLEIASSVVQYAELLLPAVLLAAALVFARGASRGLTSEIFSAALFGGGAIALGLAAAVSHHVNETTLQMSASAIALDTLTATLMALTLWRLEAQGFAATMISATTLTILEGIVIERPTLDAHIIAGALLLVYSSVWLLRGSNAAEAASQTLGL